MNGDKEKTTVAEPLDYARSTAISVMACLHNAEWMLRTFGHRVAAAKITRPYELNGAYVLTVRLRNHQTGQLSKGGRYLFDSQIDRELSTEEIVRAIVGELTAQPAKVAEEKAKVPMSESAGSLTEIATLINQACRVIEDSDLSEAQKRMLGKLLQRLRAYEAVQLGGRTEKIAQEHNLFSRGALMQLAAFSPHIRRGLQLVVRMHEQRGHLLLMTRALRHALIELGQTKTEEHNG